MQLKIIPSLLFKLSLAFIVCVAIGTLSHELGHLFIAKLLGFKVDLHYAHINWSGREASKIENFWIQLGGPLQTMFTGIIGLFVLIKRRLKNEVNEFNVMDWFWLFLGLFWLRQLSNLISSVSLAILGDEENYFGGDEAIISNLLGFPEGIVPIVTGLIGLLISLYLVFRLLPMKYRFTFINSGIIGGSLGLWLWLKGIGPILLP